MKMWTTDVGRNQSAREHLCLVFGSLLTCHLRTGREKTPLECALADAARDRSGDTAPFSKCGHLSVSWVPNRTCTHFGARRSGFPASSSLCPAGRSPYWAPVWMRSQQLNRHPPVTRCCGSDVRASRNEDGNTDIKAGRLRSKSRSSTQDFKMRLLSFSSIALLQLTVLTALHGKTFNEDRNEKKMNE